MKRRRILAVVVLVLCGMYALAQGVLARRPEHSRLDDSGGPFKGS